MTTIEKIRTEIEQIKPYELPCDKRTPEHIRNMALEIIDKYAEQEQAIRPSFSYTAEIKADDEQLERLQGILNGEMVLRLEQEPTDEWQNGYDMAWKLAEVFYEKEPCDDAISREDAIKHLTKARMIGDNRPMTEIFAELPSVKQKPKTGHWITDRKLERRACDNCNTAYRWSFFPDNYCPNCGARMSNESV